MGGFAVETVFAAVLVVVLAAFVGLFAAVLVAAFAGLFAGAFAILVVFDGIAEFAFGVAFDIVFVLFVFVVFVVFVLVAPPPQANVRAINDKSAIDSINLVFININPLKE